MRVTQFGEPVLRQKGKEVTRFDHRLKQLFKDMLETMYAHEGVGLAAQQVGLALQFFVLDTQCDPGAVPFRFTLDGRAVPYGLLMPLAVANPRIEFPAEAVEVASEGCLSFPGVRGEVPRFCGLTCHFQDLEGTPHTLVCDGFLARAVQHEYDHLQGVLFIDRMTETARREVDPELRPLRRRVRAWLESEGLKPRF